MSFIVPIRRLQPDIDTEQGSYENPFVPYSANSYLTRTAPMLQDMRGRHPYRVQPRQLGPGAMLDGVELVDNDGNTLYPGASSPYPPMPGVQGTGEFDEYLRSVQGFGQVAPASTQLTNLQIAILVGIVGLAAYFLGKHMAKKTRRNPRRNPVTCRRGWSGHHRAYLCAKCKGGSAPRRRRASGVLTSFQPKNRKLASKARQQPRDESGRFI